MKKLTILLALSFTVLLVNAQIVNPTKWTFDSKQNGNDAELIFKATVEKGWHVYDVFLPEGGPIATTINYNDSTLFDFVGDIQKSKQPTTIFDENFNLNVSYYADEITFTQKIKLLSNAPVTISGNVLFMSCNDETCTPPEQAEFSFDFNKGNAPAKNDTKIEKTSSTGIKFFWCQRAIFMAFSFNISISRICRSSNTMCFSHDSNDGFIFYEGK